MNQRIDTDTSAPEKLSPEETDALTGGIGLYAPDAATGTNHTL